MTHPDPRAPVALVTGASQRVGRAIALELGRVGWAVAVHHNRSAAAAAGTVAEIVGAGGTAAAFGCDLSDDDAVSRLVPEVAGSLGAVAVLVNNASLFLYDDIETLDDDLWHRHASVNLKAAVFLAQAMARQLPHGVAGSVINLIDQRVWKPTPLYFSYAVAKSGLWAATQMLAQALAPDIRVNAIGPGPVLQSIHQSAEQFAAQCRSTPLQRGSSPGEIASTVRFILSAPSMTGQMIALDGGQHLAWKTADVVGVEAGDSAMAATTPAVERSLPAQADEQGPPTFRTVLIEGLEVKTIIGIYPSEKQTPQRVQVSIEMTVLESGTAGSDRFDEVVDYERIVNEARQTALAGHVNLIETLAERIAAVCLKDARVREARVSVRKPDIFADCTSVGVTICRRQPSR